MVNLIGINMDTGGSSNGSGKSSLFNAICEVLFGENPTGVSKDGVVNSVMDCGFAGRVEFVSWQGITYRVTYCRKWKEDFYPVDNNTLTKYQGTTLYFDKWNGEQWMDLTTDKMINTRTAIADALGITYDRFLSVAYMSPRVASKFLRGSNAERIDIMAGVTGVEEWDIIYKRAKDRRLALQKEVASTQTRIAYVEGALNQIQERLQGMYATNWEEQLAFHEGETEKVKKYRLVSMERLGEVNVDLEDLQVKQAEAYNASGSGVISQQISDLSVEESQLRNPAFTDASLPEFDAALAQAYENAGRSYQVALGALNAVSGGSAISAMETCTLCGQKISEDHRDHITAGIDEKKKAVEYAKTFLDAAKDANEKESERVRQARQDKYAERLARADELSQQLQSLRMELQKSNLEYERLTGEINQKNSDRMLYTREVSTQDQQLSYHAQMIREAQSKVSEKILIQESANNQQKELEDLRQSISGDITDLEVLDWLIRNIPYIKLHRISVALIHLSEQVNAYLSEMGETIRVNLSSFGEKKNAKGAGDIKDTLKSEITVEVVDGFKNIDPRLYSDGETAKISNALIRGLHDISVQSGYGCNVLLLDEIFSYVDPSNAQKVADSFRHMNTGSIFVTDNSGHVNDLVRFNEQWVVRKQNGMSILEV